MSKQINFDALWDWPDTSVWHPSPAQTKWYNLLDSAPDVLGWVDPFLNPYKDDQPPPMGWTERQLISLLATLMHRRKADTLRATLIILLHDDIDELIDTRMEEKWQALLSK